MAVTGQQRVSDASTSKGKCSDHQRPGLIHDVIAVPVLGVVAFIAGCLLNAFRVEPLPWKYQSREQIMSATLARLQKPLAPPIDGSASAEPTHEIRLDEFQSFVLEHRGVVLDARASVFYREAHVPGALSLPRETFAEDYPRLREKLAAHMDQSIAVYCSGADCPDSQLLAEALGKLGYRRIVIYTSGWEEWSHTGLPQEGVTAAP